MYHPLIFCVLKIYAWISMHTFLKFVSFSEYQNLYYIFWLIFNIQEKLWEVFCQCLDVINLNMEIYCCTFANTQTHFIFLNKYWHIVTITFINGFKTLYSKRQVIIFYDVGEDNLPRYLLLPPQQLRHDWLYMVFSLE